MSSRKLAFLLGTMLLALGWSGVATAANGDNLRQLTLDRTGTQCASTDAAGNHSSIGVGIAFDGANLLASCYSDNTITENDPATGALVAVHHIAGASSLGALAWDESRHQVWACSGFATIGVIDLATNVYTPVFNPVGGCFDGLAYDGSDDTLWSGYDANDRLNHSSTAGVALGQFSPGITRSGIAVGGATLYMANDGGQQLYQSPKDLSAVTPFASFPRRLEDLECDNVSFLAASKAAIWSIDAHDNIVNAWEIPNGSCAFGGGGSGNTCGNIQGNGVPRENAKAKFEFGIRYIPGAPAPTGTVSFNDKAKPMKFDSTSISSLVITGDDATATGNGTANGLPVSFTVTIHDKPDSFSIQLSNGYSTTWTPKTGRVEIHVNCGPPAGGGGGGGVD
jgi:hypothetical protein